MMSADKGDDLRDRAVALSLEDPGPSPAHLVEKISEACPDLPPDQASSLARLALDVHDHACRLMSSVYMGKLAHEAALDALKESYPFLSPDNVQRLHSLGMYSAWRS